MDYLDFEPRKLPGDLLKAIGLVTASAAFTEHIINQAIGGISSLDLEYTGALTVNMNMPQRYKALRSAAKLRLPDDDYVLLDELISRVDKAYEERNSYVHHSWAMRREAAVLIKESARKGYKQELLEVSVEDVERIATLIYDLGIELWQFISIRGLLPDLKTVAQRKQGAVP